MFSFIFACHLSLLSPVNIHASSIQDNKALINIENNSLLNTPIHNIPSQLNIPIEPNHQYYKQELDNGYTQIVAVAIDSKLKSKWTYKKNKLEGEAITYYANGNLAFIGFYKDNMPHGTWKFYDSTGFMYLQQTFNADQLFAVKRGINTYNYKTKSTFPIVNDAVKEKSDISTILKRQKKFISPIVQSYMINWHLAFPHGEIKRYDKVGAVIEEGEYKFGYKFGIWHTYNAIGELIQSGPYIHNIKSGRWKHYQNGKLIKIEHYKNGNISFSKSYQS